MKKLTITISMLLACVAGAQSPPIGGAGLDLSQNNALATAATGHCRLKDNAGALQVSCDTGAYATLGSVTSVSNSDGTLTISPTTGAVVASLALGHANTWTGQQTFNTSNVILGANVGISGTAGTGALSFGSLTGDTALPTGAFSWAGAAAKTASLVGASTFTITGGAASTWSTTSGALTISGGGGINLQQNGTTYLDVGVTTSAVVTVSDTSVGTAQSITASFTNTTAAANNAQQYSGVIEVCGNGWSTTNSASRKVCSDFQTRPIQGAANPTWALDLYSNVNGFLTKYFTLDDTSTITTAANASFGFVSSVTMSGTAVAFDWNSTNTPTAGDKLWRFRANGTEWFRSEYISGTSGPKFVFTTNSNADGNARQGLQIASSVASGQVGITFINSGTNGKDWSVFSNGAAASGARVTGDLEIFDNTTPHGRMVLNKGGTYPAMFLNDNTITLTSANIVTLGGTLDVVRAALTTTQGIGIANYNYTVSTVGSKTQYGAGALISGGHQWDNGAAGDKLVDYMFQTQGVDVAASAPQADLVISESITATTTFSWSERARFRSRIASGLEISRVSYAEGTALIAGDFAVSGGWGTTASIGSLIGSDGAWDGTVTSSGTGQAANPTLILTFHDLGWQNSAGTTAVPVCMVEMRATTDTTITAKITWSVTATALTITYNGTPVATKTYSFSAQCAGTN